MTGKVIRDAETRRSIAVLEFKNISGREDIAWLSAALSEMLTTDLAAGEALHTAALNNYPFSFLASKLTKLRRKYESLHAQCLL